MGGQFIDKWHFGDAPGLWGSVVEAHRSSSFATKWEGFSESSTVDLTGLVEMLRYVLDW